MECGLAACVKYVGGSGWRTRVAPLFSGAPALPRSVSVATSFLYGDWRMKLSLRSLFAAAGLLVASAGVGRADDINLAPKFDPFEAPEVTLVGHCTDGCADGCASGCTDGCNTCCSSRHVGRDFWVCKDRCSGFVGGIDFLMLKPFASEDALVNGDAQFNYNPSYRLYGGWQNRDGLGARMRYFEFDRGTTGTGGALGIEVRYLDIEATQAVDFRRWNLLFAGGIRYFETNYQSGTLLSGFDGVGLTFAGQATRDLNRSGTLRLTSGARWSAVYGNTKEGTVAALNTNIDRDDLVNLLEVNIGPQWRRQLRNGGYMTLGGGLEAMYFSNGGPFTDTQDAGFAGFSTTFAITR